MATNDLFAWTGSNFKHQQATRFDAADEAAKAEADIWKAVCAAVDARDKRQCRACGKRCDPNATGLLTRAHRHHIVYRSAGGPDEAWNLATLCASCHNDEHKHRLRIDGNANICLTVYRKDSDGSFYISRQEVSPHVLVARD